MRAVRIADHSAYAGVVRLAERALADTAPVARLAVVVPVALAVAVIGWW